MEDSVEGLRERFTAALKASMKAGDAARTGTLRLILAKLKDTEIAARPARSWPRTRFRRCCAAW